jgi:hypothetical protein
MRRLPSHARLVGLGVALSLGSAAVYADAGAQADTGRRELPGIPVSKGRPGLPDTVPAPPATPAVGLTPARAAPAAVTPPAASAAPAASRAPRTWSLLGAHGLFFGVSGGTAAPTGTLSDVGYESGAHVGVPVGWRPSADAFPLGVRGLLALDQVRARETNPSRSSPKIYSLSLDGVLTLPMVSSADWYGISLYMLGGVGAYQFRGFGGAGGLADALGDDAGHTAVTRFGVDAGGGVGWDVGPAAIFVEARWVNVFARGTGTIAGSRGVRWVPILAGVAVR